MARYINYLLVFSLFLIVPTLSNAQVELMKLGASWRDGIGALQEEFDVHPL